MSALVTDDIQLAADALRQGMLVAFATETVYGLGANACDPLVVAKIFAAKQRPKFDPLIVHLADPEDLPSIVRDVPISAVSLIDEFWPGPLTLVLPKRECIPDIVTSGLPTVAVRIPAHPQARELIRRAGIPIAAPSANLFSQPSPTQVEHVLKSLGDRIDIILDGGPSRVGVESTVLRIDDDHSPAVLRPGGVPIERIEQVIGPVDRVFATETGANTRQSPGMLSRHYAPGTPLFIANSLQQIPTDNTIGVLSLYDVPEPDRFGAVEVLSPSGLLVEAAARFFAALRRLDDSGMREIWALRFPNEGLGVALNDRLQRATAT